MLWPAMQEDGYGLGQFVVPGDVHDRFLEGRSDGDPWWSAFLVGRTYLLIHAE
jgi:hypothetical protein